MWPASWGRCGFGGRVGQEWAKTGVYENLFAGYNFACGGFLGCDILHRRWFFGNQKDVCGLSGLAQKDADYACPFERIGKWVSLRNLVLCH